MRFVSLFGCGSYRLPSAFSTTGECHQIVMLQIHIFRKIIAVIHGLRSLEVACSLGGVARTLGGIA